MAYGHRRPELATGFVDVDAGTFADVPVFDVAGSTDGLVGIQGGDAEDVGDSVQTTRRRGQQPEGADVVVDLDTCDNGVYGTDTEPCSARDADKLRQRTWLAASVVVAVTGFALLSTLARRG